MAFAKFIVAAVCLALAAGATARGGEKYHNKEGHFRIELPAGWTKMPAERLAAANERAAAGVHYAAGFVIADNPNTTPFLLMQVRPKDRALASRDSIRQVWTTAFKSEVQEAEGTTRELIQKTPIGHMTMNAGANLAVRRSRIIAPAGSMEMITCAHVGSESWVTFWGFEIAAKSAEFSPVLGQINDSFAFDSNKYVFAPVDRGGLPRYYPALIGVVVGILATLMVIRARMAT